MSLKRKAITGFFWTSAGTLGNGVISLLVTMIFARLLTPYDFALIELIIVFIAISNVIVDSGFLQAIIRDDRPTQKDLSSVFYFNITIALIIYTCLFYAAPLIAKYFEAPELISLSRVVFLVIIFNSFSIIQNATLNRNLNFAAISKSSIFGTFIAGAISLTLVFIGAGIWSLVANMVLQPLFRSLLLWQHSSWRPTREFSIKSIKKYFNFGVFLMLQGIIDTIVTNVTSIIIGKVYTKNDLGYYSQGGKLNRYLITPLSNIISKVTYPILSNIKDEKARLKEGYKRIIGVLIYVMLPVSLFVFINAKNTIVFLLGEKWGPSSVYLQLFSVFGFFHCIERICINIIMVKGKTRTMFIFAILKQGLRLISIIATINISVFALATANIASSVIAGLLYIALGMYYINYNFIEFLTSLYQTIIVAIISVSATYFVGVFLKMYSVHLVLITQLLTMFIFYIGISMAIKSIYLNELINMFLPLFKVFKHKERNEEL